eukprot:1684857-Rhodomonas_salina.2
MASQCSPEQPDECIPTICGDGRSYRSGVPDTAFGNGKANNYPCSCAAYREATGVRQDGEYWLFVSGYPTGMGFEAAVGWGGRAEIPRFDDDTDDDEDDGHHDRECQSTRLYRW